MRGSINHIGLDYLAATCPFALKERQKYAHEAYCATSSEIAYNVARCKWSVARSAQHAQDSRHGDVVDVMASHVLVFAIAAKACHATND
jgi:hypothetical protein